MEHIFGMSFKEFFSIVDNMYDEILIYDKNYNIAYINKACVRHYGCNPEQMIGKSFFDFVYDDWWEPSILPVVFKEKRAYAIRQNTAQGAELLTIAVPLFDEHNEVEFVVMNVRDTVNEIDLYNPRYISVKYPRESGGEPIAKSPEMQRVLQLARRIARLDTPCIISGESGVGKTVVAQYLHSISGRKDQPLAMFDCAGMTEDKVHQELFGTDEAPGLLYKMREGTLLLEKVSELTLKAQSRLLNDLDSGASEGESKRVRLLVSTDKDLKAMMRNGQFLEELYYALNIAEIYIPPLRKRQGDIRPLIYHFLGQFCSKYNVNRHFTEGAIQAMIHGDWPKNVRELRYMIERMVVMESSPVIDADRLPKSLFGISDADEAFEREESENFDERVAVFESSLIHDAYQKYGSSRKIAEHLGLSQTRANNLIRKYIKASERA